MSTSNRVNRLLIFNLMTDADDPVLGFTTSWINALAARCEAVDVVTMQVGRLAVADNVRVYSVGKERGYTEARRAVEFYRILFSLLRKNHYQACFAHMMQLFAVMGFPLLSIAGIPITLWYAHKATGLMVQLAEKLVDHVVTSSPESFRVASRKVHIIGQGIDTELFHPATPAGGTFAMVTVSRIAPVKRIETMIAAIKALRETGESAMVLRIVGSAYAQDKEYSERLQHMVSEYGLTDTVTFVGGISHEQTIKEYQQASVMINMSATGSLDKAVLEAMACGVPVITANEAFKPLLEQWADLLIVPSESPEVLAVRLKQIMMMPPDERAKLGAQLRQLVIEQHSIQHLMDNLTDIFSS